jgi:hypothetical protein
LDEEPKAEPEPIEELEELLTSEPEAEPEPPSPAEDESLVRPSDLAAKREDAPLVLPSDVASEQAEEFVEAPEPSEVAVEPVSESAPSEPMDVDKGREVVQDILEKVKAAEARAQEDELEPPPAPLEEDEPLVYEEPVAEPEVEEPIVEPEAPTEEVIKVEEPPEPAAPTATAESAEVTPEPVVTADLPAKDEKVRKFETDLSAYTIELQQLQSEMEALRARLDEETERYATAAAVKRTRVESVERDLRLARKEFSDASKEHKNAENRRKKELSNAEKRIRDVEKRIKKAEDSKRKRLEELEKERLKREEEARKN